MKNYKRLTVKGENDEVYLKNDISIQVLINRLAKLEDEIANGTLFEFPCKIGDTIYVIPSETNFKLNKLEKLDKNNKVYEQKLFGFSIGSNDFFVYTCGGEDGKAGKAYGETWFLTEEEAQKKLEKLENGQKTAD